MIAVMGCIILFAFTGLWVLGLWKIAGFFASDIASFAAMFVYIIATMWILF